MYLYSFIHVQTKRDAAYSLQKNESNWVKSSIKMKMGPEVYFNSISHILLLCYVIYH